MANKTWRFQLLKWGDKKVDKPEYVEQQYEALGKAGKALADEFRKLAPEKTGNLKKKITYRRRKEDNSLSIVMPWYGKLTIQGYSETRYPKRGRYLKLELKGGAVLYRPQAGPIKPNPWDAPAYSKVSPILDKANMDAANLMVKRLKRRNKA